MSISIFRNPMIRHEWRLLRRDPAATWAAALLLLAVIYALVGGLGWQQTLSAEVASSDSENAEILEGQKAAAGSSETGGMPGGVKTFAVLPPGPLASFSVGLGDLYPNRAEVSVWKRPDTLFGRYQLASPLSLLTGRFDLSFVVIYLLPLFVLAISYNLLSAEREGGTLSLVLMQPVSLRQLLVAKLLLRLVLLTAFVLLLGLIGLVAAGIAPASFGRLAAWLGIAWLYGAFWLALAALVASLGSRSETAAAALAAAWLAVVLVLPNLLSLASEAIHPMPSRLEWITEMRSASNEAAQERADLLAQYYHEHPELSSNGQQAGFMPTFYAAEREIDRRLEPLMGNFRGRLEQQQEWVRGWRFLSPAVLVQETFLELAGSGVDRHRHFADRARILLADWHAAVSPRIFLGRGLAPADYDQLPHFEWTEPPISAARLFAAVLGLLVPTFLLLIWAFRSLGRYAVNA